MNKWAFPCKYRVCKDCGKLKLCSFIGAVTSKGTPLYRTRCKKCYSLYFNERRRTEKVKKMRNEQAYSKKRLCSRCSVPITNVNKSGMCKPCCSKVKRPKISEKTRNLLQISSKGRNSLSWYIQKYGFEEGSKRFKDYSVLRSKIAKNQKHRKKGYSNIELYGEEKANKIKEKSRLSHLGKKQSEETKLKRSKSMLGRIITPEARKQLSETRKRKILTGEIKLSPKAGCSSHGGFKPDLGHYVRSSYEYNFALFLKGKNIEYLYEPKRFLLPIDGDLKTFIPDFNVNGIWFEIKNSYNVNDLLFKKKLEIFKLLYPEEKIYVVIGSTKNVETWIVMEEGETVNSICIN